MGTLLGKTEVIRNWGWYYEEIFESFPEMISIKLRKSYKEILQTNILKKYRKRFAQT